MSIYIVQSLKSLGLSDYLCRSVAPYLKIVSHEAGQVLGRRGEMLNGWHMVINGYVTSTIPFGVSEESVLMNVYGPNTWFGGEFLTDEAESDFDYTCSQSSETLFMPKAIFEKLLKESTAFASTVLRLTVWRAQRLSESLLLARVGGLPVRMVVGLAQLVEATATHSGLNTAADEVPSSFHIALSQGMLARSMGVSRTILSDCVQKLASAGWLKTHYRSIEILHTDAWLKLLQSQRQRKYRPTQASIEALMLELSAAADELIDTRSWVERSISEVSSLAKVSQNGFEFVKAMRTCLGDGTLHQLQVPNESSC